MRKQEKQRIIYVFFGLIATGKSTLARAWADRLGVGCYNSDVVRKELAGLVGGEGRGFGFGQGLYSKEATRATYDRLLSLADRELTRDCSVVLDGSYRERTERDFVRELAKKHGARVHFVLCSCPEPEMKLRMDKRERDPEAVSDGRWEIYLKQKKIFEEPAELAPDELHAISTLAAPDELVARLVEIFG